MRGLLSILLCGFINLAVAESALEYDSVWRCEESRFNWYCDIQINNPSLDDKVEQPKPKLSEEDEAVASLKRLKEDAERKRALAIIKPTPENLKSYIVAQEALMDRASVFSDVWRRVIWAKPKPQLSIAQPCEQLCHSGQRDSTYAKGGGRTLQP